MNVCYTGFKDQRVKMCVIALNCLNVFMHVTKIIQAAKYMIMTCLIERIQLSICMKQGSSQKPSIRNVVCFTQCNRRHISTMIPKRLLFFRILVRRLCRKIIYHYCLLYYYIVCVYTTGWKKNLQQVLWPGTQSFSIKHCVQCWTWHGSHLISVSGIDTAV